MTGRRRSNLGAPRGASASITTVGFVTVGCMAAILLSGCIDSATNESAETTLVPLVQPNFVTLAPATSTTVPIAEAPATTPPPNVNTGGTAATTPPASSNANAPTTTAASANSSPIAGGGTYKVTANDTVYGIARKHGISADALASLNAWSDGTAHNIHPGDSVKVPDGATSTSTAGSSGATTTTVKSGATTTTIAAGSGGTYVIKDKDYLSLIAKNTGTTVDGIVAANGWSDGIKHLLIPGDTIKLPPKTG